MAEAVDPLSLTEGWPLQALKDQASQDADEEVKVRNFRKYLADRGIAKMMLKLYQFCAGAKRRNVEVHHVVQEFLGNEHLSLIHI